MPKTKKKSKPFVGEGFKISIDLTIKKLLNTNAKELEYPSSFTSEERAYIHNEVIKYGLKSKSRGKGSNRYITIFKRDSSAIMQKDATINLMPTSRTLLFTLLHKHPVSTRERQDCLPPLERSKDSFQDGKEQNRIMGRLTGGSPQVPPSSVNRNFTQFRSSLPIHALRETILHTINDNQITIVSGATGSGKTTQVPQYLLEWHERVGRPCRIICAEPRRIAAVSVSERVALERGEKLGHTVGYQIRFECKISPYTVLTYCTSGVLLRSLMSGDGFLASVTHVVIDEIHERDRLTDFVLLVLKELMTKYRALRLILMSATVDIERYSSYFNNCPVITAPGKCYEIKEYFLEDILKQLGYMSSKMEKIKNESDKRKAQAAELDRWTAAVCNKGESIEKTSQSIKKSGGGNVDNSDMDTALSDAWVFGTDDAFAQVLYLIQSENVPIDYQHSETGVTALMVAGARGSMATIERLLELGADPFIRASNNYTALDWTKYQNNKDVFDLLHTYLLSFESNETVTSPEPEVEKKLSDADRKLLQLYQSSVSDELIDINLILSLLIELNNENVKGAILVFLPGYDDIMSLKELIQQEEKTLTQKNKILIFILHSNMQTCDQKLVFKAPPPGTRKIILSTNIGETSITIDDVVYVIDTGKMKEKSYNALCGISQLSSVWISKSCALQRKGRAGRTQPGVCYRLYSTLRYEAMPLYKTPEMLCMPLQELCLYSKSLALPNTSIVDFLSRAIDPPSSLVCRSAVTLLKTIDALDTWEDLTALGHHLVDLPLDPKYGKMLIYACFLKCLDPVLTIVSCLSHRDVFILPSTPEGRKQVPQERVKFASGSLSDHMVLLRVFQEWQIARKQGRERQFCNEHFINGGAMEYILGTRALIMAQLRSSGFVISKGPGDIKYVNTNSENWAVVKAAIVAGLHPNLARIDRDHNVLRTIKEHKVGLHNSSVLQEGRCCGDVGSVIGRLPTDWVVYEELTRVGRLVQIKTATVVSPLTVALFGGPSKIPFDAISDTHMEGSQDSDSDEEDVAPDLTATLKLDDWIIFRMDSECAQLVLQLRIKWHSLLAKKLRVAISNKTFNLVDEFVINAIVRVLSAEEQSAGLTQPTGVGRRPYFTSPPHEVSKRFESININKSSCETSNMNSSGTSSSNSSHTNSVDVQRTNCMSQLRYFVIKAGPIKAIESSVVHKAWCFSPNTQNKIIQAFKGGKTVILVFSIQGSGHFQGYARLTGDSPMAIVPELGTKPPLPIEWIKRGNLLYQATRHLINPYTDNTRVHTSRDGQEIEPTVGECLCQLWDQCPPPWHLQTSGTRHHRNYHGGHNSRV